MAEEIKTHIATVSILVKEREAHSTKVNEILSRHGDRILARLGVNLERSGVRDCSGLIEIVVKVPPTISHRSPANSTRCTASWRRRIFLIDGKDMRSPLKKHSKEPTFSQKGLRGYAYPLENDSVEAYLVDVRTGHDDFIVSRTCTHIYHVIDGKGAFMVDGKPYKSKPGVLFEIPPGIEFTYSGTMRLLLIMTLPWHEGNA